MSVILSHVSMTYGDDHLYAGVTFELHRADRVALLGRNGSGKTTLLRLIGGALTPTAGHITTAGRLAYLPQFTDLPEVPLLDAVRPPALDEALQQLRLAESGLTDPTHEVLNVYGAAEETYRLLGGYDFDQRAAEVLHELELNPGWNAERLSGGQRRRTLLARLLLTPADTYLLDEPTNHLDWPSLEWLEGWVQASPAAFLIVSHDRAFLDATVTRCAELERGELREYPGNYTEAIAVKRNLREARERQYQAHQRKAQSLEQERVNVQQRAASTDRYNHKRKKPGNKKFAKMRAQDVARTLARRAKALEQRLDRMEAPKRLLTEPNLVRVALSGGADGPHDVLGLSNVALAVGDRPLLQGLTAHVRRGEKVAVVGPNGSGKSTLLRALLGQLEPSGGELRRAELAVQWSGQHGEELAAFSTQREALLAADDCLTPQRMYEVLAPLGLPRNLEHRVQDLSGGQRTRLSLARLSLTAAQLLILDEPTNHLDHAAIESLQAVLQSYSGTLIFASHDRQLVADVATRYWWLEEGELRDVTDLGLETRGNGGTP
ncbi:ABC-F family ATP-binding cassette domain-containing protein [Deinococcus hopiensis]|uniref:ATP-binding cassette, subfamily F, member 3 n=1 Tax=Deinococcus hopiensis KR-140 TaxID=695939 RepID=A0A1W1UB37_9DEIO|nr:ABC-F family ATP-binding cassette domain-containing protein [Deinococcus hopiensis]SMB78273.1 ATP-binding cassette, subfamily F, member 3 [Deinococcus hopiensis KR-140]